MKDDFDKRSSNHEFDVHEVRKITLNSIQTRHSTIIESINKQIEEAARDGLVQVRISEYAKIPDKPAKEEALTIEIMKGIEEYYKSLGFITSLGGPTYIANVSVKYMVWILEINWAYDSLKTRQLDTNHPFIKSALK